MSDFDSKQEDIRFSQIVSSVASKLFNKMKDTPAFSPTSITLALLLARAGASGQSLQQFNDFLGLPNDVNELVLSKVIRAALARVPDGMFVANSIWLQKSFHPFDAYVEHCKDVYSAQICPITTVEAFNTWVKQHTGGFIRDVLSNIDNRTVALLVNALYFEGKWSRAFDVQRTVALPFYHFNPDDMTSEAQTRMFMVSDELTCLYKETEELQVVSLPYQQRGFHALVVKPKTAEASINLFENWSTESWGQFFKNMQHTPGILKLPKFKLSGKTCLKSAMMENKLVDPFDSSSASFQRMTSDPVFMSDVIHQVVVEVDENGTKAAAVTVVDMFRESRRIPWAPKFTMTVDCPFLFVVYGSPSRTDSLPVPWFVARVFDPMA